MLDMLETINKLHPLERFLVILGAGVCLLITVTVWRNVSSYQAMWPLPGWYFVEMAALSILSAVAFIRGGPAGKFVAWGAVGIFAAFSVIGSVLGRLSLSSHYCLVCRRSHLIRCAQRSARPGTSRSLHPRRPRSGGPDADGFSIARSRVCILAFLGDHDEQIGIDTALGRREQKI